MQNIETIYNDYFSTVYKYLFCLTKNHDLSEELTQETFFKAITKIGSFREESKISTWLCTIARNLYLNELKKQSRLKYVSDEELSSIESLYNLETMVIEDEESQALFKKISKLDSLTKQVLILRISGDLSFKEISDILGKTENWARITYYRGKEKLKEVNLYE